MVEHLTPDQKVACSNHVRVSIFFRFELKTLTFCHYQDPDMQSQLVCDRACKNKIWLVFDLQLAITYSYIAKAI